MTKTNESEAMEVWRKARRAFNIVPNPYPNAGTEAAARVIATALGARDAEIERLRGVRDIHLGSGKCIVNWGYRYGVPALFIEPTSGETGEHGASVPEHLQSPSDALRPGSVALVLDADPVAFLEELDHARAILTKGNTHD